jgi:prepilin-type N-terminal cleavage/methylation domain-containing protein
MVNKEDNMKKLIRILKSEKGFTLIELLVVVAILGAIAGVVVLNVGSFVGKGKCEGYCTEKHNVVTACMASAATSNTTDAWTDYVLGGNSGTKWTWTVSADCSTATAAAKTGGDAVPSSCTSCP